ncbi:MAG: hypothetical protein CME88_05555 [Hirschia sp.]|nr:hypothetical protein [Hirschia sp.]MBF17831.1 hypothetical protein [Hirschia sp.]
MSGAAKDELNRQNNENKAFSETERDVPTTADSTRNDLSHGAERVNQPPAPTSQITSQSTQPPQDAPSSKAPHLVVVSNTAENADRMGPRLKAARENLNLTILDVAKATRIRKEYLLDIEEMYVKNLPGMPQSRTYLRAWIKAYARFVEMSDLDQVVERYLRECGLSEAPGSTVKSHASVETAVTGQSHARMESARPKGGFVAGLATALVLVGAVGAAVWFLGPWSSDDAPVAQTSRAPIESASVATSPQFNAPTVAANLSIKALKTSWIEVRGSDGTVYLSKQMLAGDVYVPRVGAGWTVTVADGAAFEWRRDGVSLGLVSEGGGQVHSASVDNAVLREPVVEVAE